MWIIETTTTTREWTSSVVERIRATYQIDGGRCLEAIALVRSSLVDLLPVYAPYEARFWIRVDSHVHDSRSADHVSETLDFFLRLRSDCEKSNTRRCI